MLVVDKPRGPTSHDIVKHLRKVLGASAVGHSGTLDPMATGVLVVAIGEATKLVPWLTAHDKSYEASIALGVETDTLDAEGREIRPRRAERGGRSPGSPGAGPAPSDELLERALRRGERAHQPVAARATRRSARGGERAFDRARRGESVELAARPVQLLRIELTGCQRRPSLPRSVGRRRQGLLRSRPRARPGGAPRHGGPPDGAPPHPVGLLRRRGGRRPSTAPPSALQPLAHAAASSRASGAPVVRLTEAGAREARHGAPVPAEMDRTVRRAPRHGSHPTATLVRHRRLGDDGRGRVVRGIDRRAAS